MIKSTKLSCLALSFFLIACASTPREAPAPVEQRNINGQEASPTPLAPQKTVTTPIATKPIPTNDWRPATHTVQQGQTLYSIALEYGLDYQELALWNTVEDVNLIKVGQVLRLTPPAGAVIATDNAIALKKPAPLVAETISNTPTPNEPPIKKTPVAVKLPYSESAEAEVAKKSGVEVKPLAPKPNLKPNAVEVNKPKPPTSTAPSITTKPVTMSTPPVVASSVPQINPSAESVNIEGVVWQWPTTGKVIAGFSASKGVDISGAQGQPVYASADGKVVYSGTGLRGYGKLLIVKHNQIYLTAYAHNSAILVKEGGTVKRGQKIAEMGDTDTNQIKLHFEVRQYGKPVDPIKYLPTRK